MYNKTKIKRLNTNTPDTQTFTNILDLNDDCLLQIVKFIPKYELDKNFRHVCQRFMNIYCILKRNDGSILDLNTSNHSESFQHYVHNMMDAVDTVCIWHNMPEPQLSEQLNFITENVADVRHVHWHGYPYTSKIVYIQDQYFKSFLSWTHLQTLELRNVNLNVELSNLINFFELINNNLKQLTLNNVNLNPNVFSEICQKSHNLEKLDIRNNRALTLDCYEEMSQKCLNLKALKISLDKPFKNLEWLQGLPKLVELEVSPGGLKLLDALVKYKTQQLEILHFYSFTSVSSEEIEKLSQLQKLKILSITQFGSNFQYFKNIKNLQEISLANRNKSIPSELDFAQVLEDCPLLKSLYIFGIKTEQILEIVAAIKRLDRNVPFTVYVPSSFYNTIKEALNQAEVLAVSNKFRLKPICDNYLNCNGSRNWINCRHTFIGRRDNEIICRLPERKINLN